MKYKLINAKTNEETLCDKVTIDGFDYYVSDEEPTLSDTLNTCYYIFNNTLYKREYSHHKGCKKLIATNNPSIDIPKVIDEVGGLAKKSFGNWRTIKQEIGFKVGYNKSQETHPFSEKDMIEFHKWAFQQVRIKESDLTTKELLQLWKQQQPKTLYYE